MRADKVDTRHSRSPPVRFVVFFDFDGVIVESSDVKTQAFARLFSHLPDDSVKRILDYHRANAGISRFRKFEWIYDTVLAQPLSEAKRAELGARFSELTLQRVLDAPLVPGVEGALDALHEIVPLYVASGTPQDELEKIVAERQLSGYFHAVYGSPATKAVVVREVLASHDLSPGQALFIGDGPSDYRAAVETGVHFLARDSEEHHPYWLEVGATRVPDMVGLEDRIMDFIRPPE